MRFCPYTQTRVGTTMPKTIHCYTNQPAELTLTLNNKPLPARLKVTSHSCYKRIEFNGPLSFCYNGTYRCIAKNQSGAVLTKKVNVTIFPCKLGAISIHLFVTFQVFLQFLVNVVLT